MISRAMLVMVTATIVLAQHAQRRMPPAAPAAPGGKDLLDLVFVTEDFWDGGAGCEAISVLDVGTGEAIYRGEWHPSPGRLTSTSDLSVLVAGVSANPPVLRRHRDVGPFLYMLKGDVADRRQWETRARIWGPNFAAVGGVAILPDDDTLLVATVGRQRPPGSEIQYPRPYRVEKYRLSEIRPSPEGEWELGPRHGWTERLSGVPAEIVPTADGRRAHVLLEDGWVITLDTTTLEEVDTAIAVARVEMPRGNRDEYVSILHASMTADERYLVSNRYYPPELNVADLWTRQSWTLSVDGVLRAGGIAINHGWQNTGLLALHGGTEVVVYGFEPRGPLVELGRAPVRWSDGWMSGPINSVAWDARGSRLIAASPDPGGGGAAEFAVFEVGAGGAPVTFARKLTACVLSDGNGPNDIVTANGKLTPPSTPTASPTDTVTPTATASPTVSPMPPATATATARPRPIYLPLILGESCEVRQVYADVVLVLDASTSMLRPTRAGRSKLRAAQEAARSFLGLMEFMPHENGGRDQVAVVGFNATAWVEQPLSVSEETLRFAIRQLSERVAEGTRLDLAVEQGAEVLESQLHSRANTAVVILLTDGLPNRVPTPAPAGRQEDTVLAAARAAKEQGIRIYTIGLGKADGTDPADRINAELLRAVASDPSMYYETPDAEELEGIYSEIAYTIGCPPEQFWGQRE